MESRITLFLMTRKGFKVLEALGSDFSETIDFVVTQRDKSVQNDYYSEIRALCEQLNIPCYDRRDDYLVKSGYAIAVSWRWLIDLRETTLIVFHDSLLPKYRGFNPLVSYLINGEPRIGVTALLASEEYDRGDIVGQIASEITYPRKIADAIEIVSEDYAELATQIVSRIQDGGQLRTIPQEESEASYSLWRDEEDYRIDWSLPATEIRRTVDATGFPYKGASTIVNGRLARILEMEEIADVPIENRAAGKVIFIKDSCPVVVCGRDLAKIKTLIDDETGENMLPLKSMRTRFI